MVHGGPINTRAYGPAIVDQLTLGLDMERASQMHSTIESTCAVLWVSGWLRKRMTNRPESLTARYTLSEEGQASEDNKQ